MLLFLGVIAIAVASVARWLILSVSPDSYVRYPNGDTNVWVRYASTTFFTAPYKSEAAMCVTEILEDLAEMVLRAAEGRAPEPGAVQVRVTEESGSRPRHPRYRVDFTLRGKAAHLSLPVEVMWDHETYGEACKAMLALAGKTSSQAKRAPESDAESLAMLERLLDADAVTIVRESRLVSEALSQDFVDPAAHERAAFLHGVLVLREQAGLFSDPRLGLCRLAAHLAMARNLDQRTQGVAGDLAEAIGLVVMRRQTELVQRLGDPAIEPNAPVAAWIRILRGAGTGDYRGLANPRARSLLEQIAWLRAYSLSVGTRSALAIVPYETLKDIPDFVRTLRAANCEQLVQPLARDGMRCELQEQQRVFREYFGTASTTELSANQLNVHPGHCFSTNGSVRIIDWGHWAAFFQRHLLNDVYRRYQAKDWLGSGADDVLKAANQARTQYADLVLQPVLLQQMRPDWMFKVDRLDEAVALARAHPELIPTMLWGKLEPVYRDAPSVLHDQVMLATADWFHHYPLPGTGLVMFDYRADYGEHGMIGDQGLLEELGRMAPYDLQILRLRDPFHGAVGLVEIVEGRPGPDRLRALWEPASEYMIGAMREMADLSRDHPDDYERRLLGMARLSPAYYLDLGFYFSERKNTPKAIQYVETGFAVVSDSSTLAQYVGRAVELELDAGRVEKASEMAQQISEGGCYQGLAAQARIHERAHRLREAYNLYARVEQEYGEQEPLISFCARAAPVSIGTAAEPLIFEALERFRPKDCERVSVADFHGPPEENEGVDIIGANPIVAHYGFKEGDVVVALDGLRVRTRGHLERLRQIGFGPKLRLIIWDGTQYRDVVCEDSDRLDGFPFGFISPRRQSQPLR
ncbi:MAG: hypothetical protein HY299_11685 [Verrucomicrobia bacterium]|nr:hypothetical protein [Verrucomicrobiota bacterium]